jgi:hypothetical protein
MTLKFHVDSLDRAYTGPELRPHFILSTFGVRGSAIVAFKGPCKVETAELVDWEDRIEKDRIESACMLHFLGEFFGLSLREGVFFQRLFVASLYENLFNSLPQLSKAEFRRQGDDLFFKERKLSVSIVTASPVSVVMHTGLNIDPSGAPVAAVGLSELGIAHPLEWAQAFLQSVQQEWESIEWACTKVRPVI